MVRQRFFVLFRRWAFTVARVLGPVFVFEVVVLVRQHSDESGLSRIDLCIRQRNGRNALNATITGRGVRARPSGPTIQ